MEQYYEQSVAAEKSLKESVLYVLCWILIVVLLLAALLFAANITGNQPGEASVNWLCAFGLAVCAVSAAWLYRRKDFLRMEYDYTCNGSSLEICAVMNRRRRKKLAVIELQRVMQAGCGNANNQMNGKSKVYKWYANTACNYIVFMTDNTRCIALLEMDDALTALVRSRIPAGAWRNEEGKTSNYASLS